MEIQTLILDTNLISDLQEVFSLLPTPPFDEAEKAALAGQVYQLDWQQSGVRRVNPFKISAALACGW